MAGQLARDLLRELDDEAVRVEDVKGPVPPRPVDGSGQDLDPQVPKLLGLGIDVVDEEENLTGRPALGGGLPPDQLGQRERS
jgi:hypothetical protein